MTTSRIDIGALNRYYSPRKLQWASTRGTLQPNKRNGSVSETPARDLEWECKLYRGAKHPGEAGKGSGFCASRTTSSLMQS